MTALATEIFLSLWKENYIVGADVQWHPGSLDKYFTEIITHIEEIIAHGSERPKGSIEVGGVFALPEGHRVGGVTPEFPINWCSHPAPHFPTCHVRDTDYEKARRALDEPYDSADEASHHDGGDRVGGDESPVPCEETISSTPNQEAEGTEDVESGTAPRVPD